ncbi:hypothetical protein ACFLJF_005845 [Salmonella enterica]|uniref:Uncharacterized protein n=1 Tax=Salmonella enterica subsp. enterica serovar Rough O:d:1,7 TaxID=1974323 RepID=A0A974KDA6_SALET|nr:hypothetical protein [Salmonella enterica]ECD4943428.1 hypothetical protein [Salmonella enterica subsp. enterica serovar Muenchen]ECJ7956141.1 hypothetical protein [Salmonella enterica subsp. enterica serovar Muenchen]EJG5922190.1 hypothetical protein [Salmonella enterica]ELX2844766.1 hypothetical protein [Salmonella enterica]OSD65513.1 hypothetical protein R537_23190 [Salmonella enterica subsp. enterica serovar Rough O:d:1,7]
MGFPDFSGFFSAIKDSLEALKKAYDLKQSIAIDQAVNKVYEQLNSLQEQLIMQRSRHDAISREKDAIERELINLKQHLQDAERYELHQLEAGGIVYRVKPGYESGQPLHYWCASCYDQQIKSVLQPGIPKNGHNVLHCNNCNSTILSERNKQKPFAFAQIDKPRGY